MSLYARVVTDDPTNKELDYLVPPPWESKVHVGSRVKVPLRSRDSLATVVALVDESTAPGIKNVAALVSEEPVLDPRMLELTPLDGGVLLLSPGRRDPLRATSSDPVRYVQTRALALG